MLLAHAPNPAPACSTSMPMCPARARRPASRRSSSFRRTRRRSGPRRARVEAVTAAPSHLELYPDGSATQLREAIARQIRARSGAHRLRRRLGRAPVAPRARLSRAGRRGHVHGSTASSSTGSPSSPRAARRSWRRRRTTPPMSMRILAAVTPRTKIVFLANPNNPTGTYLPVRRGQAPACGPAARRAPRPRRGLCRICPPQRLRVRPRARRDERTMS